MKDAVLQLSGSQQIAVRAPFAVSTQPGSAARQVDSRLARLVESMDREVARFAESVELLGGRRVFKHRVASRAEAHAAIVEGVPAAALLYFVDRLQGVGQEDVVHVLGISVRTLRRQRDAPQRTMPVELASRTWLLAETVAKATEIFGSRELAESWLSKPALGLDDQRPIELLQTLPGAELVRDFLGRLEHNVYS